MNKTLLMDLAKRRREPDGNGQKARQRKRSPEHPFQKIAPRVLEHEHAPPLASHDRPRPHRPRRIKIVRQRIFVLKLARGRQLNEEAGRHYACVDHCLPVMLGRVVTALVAMPPTSSTRSSPSTPRRCVDARTHRIGSGAPRRDRHLRNNDRGLGRTHAGLGD